MENCSIDAIIAAAESNQDPKSVKDFANDVFAVMTGQAKPGEVQLKQYFNPNTYSDPETIQAFLDHVSEHTADQIMADSRKMGKITFSDLQDLAAQNIDQNAADSYELLKYGMQLAQQGNKDARNMLVAGVKRFTSQTILDQAVVPRYLELAQTLRTADPLSPEFIGAHAEFVALSRVGAYMTTSNESVKSAAGVTLNQAKAQTAGHVDISAAFNQNLTPMESADLAIGTSQKFAAKNLLMGTISKGGSLWLNGLFSPVTFVVNGGSGALQTALMPVYNALGGVASGDISAVRNGFHLYGGLNQWLSDMTNIAGPALDESWRFMNHGGQQQHLLEPKFTGPQQPFFPEGAVASGNPADTLWHQFAITAGLGGDVPSIGTLLRLPTRITVAQDFLVRTLNNRLKLSADIHEHLLGSGLDINSPEYNSQYSQMFQDHANNAESSMWQSAAKYGAKSVFGPTAQYGEDGTLLGHVAKLIEAGKRSDHPLLALLTNMASPFTNMLGRLADEAYQLAPGSEVAPVLVGKVSDKLGGMPTAASNNWDTGGWERRTLIGKQIAGFMIALGCYSLWDRGYLHGTGQRDKRKLLDGLGDTGGDIPIPLTGQSVNVLRVAPQFGLLVNGYANIFENHKLMNDVQQQDALHSMYNDTMTMIDSFSDIGMAGSLGDFYKAVTGMTTSSTGEAGLTPKVENFLGRQLGSFVPGTVNFFNKLNDPNKHDAYSLMDNVKKRIPSLSEGVPRTYNLIGEAMPDSPTASFIHSELKDPVKKEIVRLVHSGARIVPMPFKYKEADLRNFVNDKGETAYESAQHRLSTITVDGKTLHQALAETINDKTNYGDPASDTDKDPHKNTLGQYVGGYRASEVMAVINEYRNEVLSELSDSTDFTYSDGKGKNWTLEQFDEAAKASKGSESKSETLDLSKLLNASP